MPATATGPINIVGAGLAGALLAVMLARRGLTVHLYERRADPRHHAAERGRSINLALAARGIVALEHAGVMPQVQDLLIPMRGRMIHEESGHTQLQPYGRQPHEVIYSVSRAALNRVLIEAAATHAGVTFSFGQTCLGADLQRNELHLRPSDPGGAPSESAQMMGVSLTPTIAADGAGSVLRHTLAQSGHIQTTEDWLDHDYKELTIPAAAAREVLDPHALHIWPRGGFMLIALPNTDGSFTATLFLPRAGPNSFAELTDTHSVAAFFREHFRDATALLPALTGEFAAHRAGQMATVHSSGWHWQDGVLLLGDAAHAIVPFHGQGMNAAFEDCRVLDGLLQADTDWGSLFARFEAERRPNTEAIAQMALENYTEMRATVLDAGFRRRRALALELETRFPQRFIPRYAMVMFHPEIPYAEALRRGAIQEEILQQLDASASGNAETPGNVDFGHAARLISQRLPALASG
ncbi:MAG: FAD-dependent monooxygenase [Sinobacteraceae bacterium]|nr:FAD-dependent monooxygenase [Nevskiaceae bacterium]